MDFNDTIVSLCTGAIMSAVSMIRVSGNKAVEITNKLIDNGFDDLNQGTVETVRMEDIKEEDFSFKTAKESQFKFVDDEDY